MRSPTFKVEEVHKLSDFRFNHCSLLLSKSINFTTYFSQGTEVYGTLHSTPVTNIRMGFTRSSVTYNEEINEESSLSMGEG